VEGLD